MPLSLYKLGGGMAPFCSGVKKAMLVLWALEEVGEGSGFEIFLLTSFACSLLLADLISEAARPLRRDCLKAA